MAAANPFPGSQATQTPRPHTPGQAGGVAAAPSMSTQIGSPQKEVNTASLCRIGQETVQDIVQKTMELFSILKTLQLPNGVSPASSQQYQDRKAKLEDVIKQLTQVHFKKLRLVYDKVKENTADLDTPNIEASLPIEGTSAAQEVPMMTDTLKYVSEEHKDVVEQVQAKNRQLKEIIDQLRTIIWEINTMMAMKKT